MRFSSVRLTLALPLALLLGAGLVAGGCGGGGEAPRTAIVLVTIDTLRADHLSGYGHPRATSPELDRLMERGATFTWAFSTSSSTAPSHASILTGLYPSQHSVGAFNGHHTLGDEVDTLAELLARRGFRTAAVVSNPVLARSLGLDQGFALYDDDFEGEESQRDAAERYADAAVDRALALLDDLRGGPFFLWLHVQDPHGPYDPPEDVLARFPPGEGDDARTLPVGFDYSGYRAIPFYQAFDEERTIGQYLRRYDGEIAYADRELGRLFDALEADEALRNALVIVTADHGEALGEDDFYFAHSHSLELDLVRVPLVVVGPGVEAGLRESRPVSNAWIFDTVLRFADAAGEGVAPRPGRDLLTPARGSTRWVPEPVYMASLGQVAVAREGRFSRRDRVPARIEKFWARPNPNSGGFWKPLGSQTLSLASGEDAAPDASTQRLLDAEAREMAEWNQRFGGRSRAAPPSEERLEKLRALGYVQ